MFRRAAEPVSSLANCSPLRLLKDIWELVRIIEIIDKLLFVDLRRRLDLRLILLTEIITGNFEFIVDVKKGARYGTVLSSVALGCRYGEPDNSYGTCSDSPAGELLF